MRPRDRRWLPPRASAGQPGPSGSGAAARSGAGAEGTGGGSPDPARGERADRIWSLREAWSEVAPCAVGPRAGARLCGGLEAPAPPSTCVCVGGYLCVPVRVDAPASEVLACLCTRVSVHKQYFCVPATIWAPSRAACESVSIPLQAYMSGCESAGPAMPLDLLCFCRSLCVPLYLSFYAGAQVFVCLSVSVAGIFFCLCVSSCHLCVSVCISE